MWFLRTIVWRKYIKVKLTVGVISANETDKEKVYFKFLLKNWYLNSSTNKLEDDLKSILEVRSILLFAIKNGFIDDRAHDKIVLSIKKCGKHGWEIIIDELTRMTWYFKDFHELVLELLKHANLKVRETALIVMEDGSFTNKEKTDSYLGALTDKSKSIRIRGLDMIGRENPKFRNLLKSEVERFKLYELDPDIIESCEYLLSKK